MSETTEDSLLVLQKPARGRPRIEEPRNSVSTWLRAQDHDKLIKLARQREVTVSALLRAIVIRTVTPKT